MAIEYGDVVPDEWLPNVYGVLELADDQKFYNGQLVNAAAADYIATLDPPFSKPWWTTPTMAMRRLTVLGTKADSFS